MKTILVLGAGDGSIPTYRAAQALGFRTLGVDRNPDAVARPLADEFLPLCIRESEAIIAALADRDDIVGVVAPATDLGLASLRAVADTYGFPRLSDGAIAAAWDKVVFLACCAAVGAPTYQVVTGTTVDALVAGARTLRGPMIVKPRDGSGSRGVRRCSSVAEVRDAAAEALDESTTGRAVVEEYVEGSHHTIEAFWQDGRLALSAITTRVMTPPPFAVTESHRAPSGLPPAVEQRVVDLVSRVCRHVDFGWGPLDVDFVVDPAGEVYLIEMGARVGGSGYTELIRHSFGVDVAQAYVQGAAGLPLDLGPAHEIRPGRLFMLHSDRAGELLSVRGEREVRSMPELRDMAIVVRPGDAVASYTKLTEKLGWAVLTADTEADIARAGQQFLSTLQFDLGTATRPDLRQGALTV